MHAREADTPLLSGLGHSTASYLSDTVTVPVNRLLPDLQICSSP